MILDLRKHKKDYFGQFTKNGVIVDTSVLRVLIDGMVFSHISNKHHQDFTYLMYFLDLIQMNNAWSRFFITPHILTETCIYLRKTYMRWSNNRKILELVIPVMLDMKESDCVKKAAVLNSIDIFHPVIEVGDISICLMADEFVKNNQKIAFLSIDSGLNSKYATNQNVLAMDFRQNILNYA